MALRKSDKHSKAPEPTSVVKPGIVSASRATDIPAFYSQWLLEQLRRGFTEWKNPFNGKKQIVSFENTRLIVFWSKNPAPLIPLLERKEISQLNYYFHFTLNDYERENLEPNLPSLSQRIETFIWLSEKVGKERVIWRLDPILLTRKLDNNQLLKRIENIGNQIHNYTTKLVFSFIDIAQYPAIQRRISRSNVSIDELDTTQRLLMAERIARLNQKWNLNLATCAEALSLESFGIQHNKCIDDQLIRQLFPNDIELMNYLSTNASKDKGQRKDCLCIKSKDIGFYNSCQHRCIYCYACRNCK